MKGVAKIRVWTLVIHSIAALSASAGARADNSKQPAGKRIAVAAFNAPEAPRARNEVLATLSEHTEVEVVALEDIAFEARRLQVSETSTDGRIRLSEELGIDAWLDGTVDRSSARFTLHTPDGEVISSTSLQGENVSIMAGLAGQKIWRAMGPWLSDRELHKRRVENQEDLAREKIRARERELSRLRQVVRDRAQARVKALRAAKALAKEKRTAFLAELDRQQSVVSERLAEADRARLDAERRQKQAEEAEFAASLRYSPGPAQGQAQGQRAVASVWGAGEPVASNAPSAGRANTNVWSASGSGTSRSAAEPHASTTPSAPSTGRASGTNVWSMSGGTPNPAVAREVAPSTGANGGRANATNVWSTSGNIAATESPEPSAKAASGKSGSPPSSRANSAVPLPSPWLLSQGESTSKSKLNPPNEAKPQPSTPPTEPASTDGLSPATRRWLEQQQMR